MSTINILLVEDDLIDQVAFDRAFADASYPHTNTAVSSAREAREILAQKQFDIIVCDYLLDGSTAFDVMEDAGETPVVIVTGFGDEEIAVQAMKAGAFDYLIKDSRQNYLKILPIVVENTMKRREAEKQAALAEAERLRISILHELVRNASHDLRTPLTILGASIDVVNLHATKIQSLAAASVPDIEAMGQLAAKIQNRCDVLATQKQRLDTLLISMLTLVELDIMHMPDRSEFDLALLTTQIVDSFQSQAERRDVRLTLSSVERDVRVFIGMQEYKLMLENLLKNALENTPPGGIIRVELSVLEEGIKMKVEDSGVGIPESALPLIFDRFYRIDSARTTATGGAGLGLAIVKRIIELHGGTIEVESTVGEGSIFHISIPHTSSK